MKVKLYEFQKKAVKETPDKWGFWYETGLGKTYIALSLIEDRLDLKNQKALIICPKIVRANWEHHIKQQGLSNIIVRTKENMVKEWDTLPKCDAVVYDEFHFALSKKQKTKGKKVDTGKTDGGRIIYKYENKKPTVAGAFRYYLSKNKPQYIWPLTATPYKSSSVDGPWDLYVAWYIIRGVFPMDYNKFLVSFFDRFRIGHLWVSKAKTDEKTKEFIINSYKKIGSFLKRSDVYEMPPTVEEDIFFQPTISQINAIKKIDDIDHMTVSTKTWQILNGTLKGDDYNPDKTFTSEKVDWVLEYVKNSKENLFVVCRHTLEIKRFKELLDDMGVKTYVISGQEKPDFKELNDDKGRYVVIGQASSLVGFDILNVDTMIFFTVSFGFVDFVQASGRITRGKSVEEKGKIKYYYLQISDTIDQSVYEKVKNKKNFNIRLYER